MLNWAVSRVDDNDNVVGENDSGEIECIRFSHILYRLVVPSMTKSYGLRLQRKCE